MSKRPVLVAIVVLLLSAVAFSSTGYAFDIGPNEAQETVLSDFDVRDDLPAVMPSQAVQDAVDSFANNAGTGVRATWNDTFGTPAMLTRSGGYIDGTTRSGTAADVARTWLMDHRDMYGLSEADVNNLVVVRDYAMPGTGVHPVTFQQTFNGVQAAAGGRLIVAVAPDGRVLSVSAAAQPSAPVNGEFALSASDALLAVTSELAPDVDYTPELSGEENGWTVFSGGGVFPTVQRTRQAMFPMGSEVKPVWRILFIEKLNEGYDVLVDATSGEILYRRSLVAFDGPEGLVFENYPGAPDGGTQIVKSFEGDPNASPNGWVDVAAGISGPTTAGNNADSYANWSNFLAPEGTGIVRPVSLLSHFNYGFSDQWGRTNCQATPPSYAEDVESAVTNLFYHHNLFHDHLYNLGWVEGAGNLQIDNFGNGGQGGDPILGLAQAGAVSGGAPLYTGRDNAYMLTNPDGVPSWSGMFLWEPIPATFEGVCADGDYDASVIYHEYSHALSTRLVAGGESLTGHQSGSMGEAWGDWYGISYLMSHGLQNDTVVGKYVTGNHEVGIRNWSLVDNPTGFGDIGYDITGPEVHADGEIWAAILWQVREALVAKYGAQQGAQIAEQLVTDAMPISAPNPTFVDMRDAILTADVARYHGDNFDELWTVFAQRGLGAGATADSVDDINPEPAFAHLNPARNGRLVGRLINASNGQPVADARIIVGRYEARTSAAAKSGPDGRFGLDIVEGSYDVTIQARGFGARTLEDVQIVAGENNRMKLQLQPNYASLANDAEIESVSSEWVALPARNAFDDTEATVWATEDGVPFDTSEWVVLDLAGDKPVDVQTIQVSAFKDINKSRFAALKDFTLQVSDDGVTWNTVLADSFDASSPRPTAPELHYRTWELDSPVQATHVRFFIDSPQDKSLEYAQVAEVQVFGGSRRVKVDPMPVPEQDPVSEEGTVIGSNPVSDQTGGVTENEFVQTCNPDPASEGVDGWVMEVPEDFIYGPYIVTAQGPGEGLTYDFDLYFYAADCTKLGGKASAAADETGVMAGGTRYVVADLWLGANVPLTLTVAPVE